MTYLDWYLSALYDLLELGGKQEDVDRVVNEVNNPTREGLGAYMRSLKGPHGPCGTCGEPFAVPSEPPALDQEVLCPNCAPPTKAT